jgi:addiction module HigA family antidote
MTTRKTKTMPPIHPGEVLAEDFMKPLGVSQYRLAKEMSVPACHINLIVKGRQAITADTALRLGRYFAHGSAVLDEPASTL